MTRARRDRLRSVSRLLGTDRLGRIQRALVQRGMGADRQRHHAKQAGDHGNRTTGDELPYIHRGTSCHRQTARPNSSRANRIYGLRGRSGWCRPIASNLRRRNKETLNPQYPPGKTEPRSTFKLLFLHRKLYYASIFRRPVNTINRLPSVTSITSGNSLPFV